MPPLGEVDTKTNKHSSSSSGRNDAEGVSVLSKVMFIGRKIINDPTYLPLLYSLLFIVVLPTRMVFFLRQHT